MTTPKPQPTDSSPTAPRELHARLEHSFETQRLSFERLDARYSTLRLIAFLSAAVLIAGGAWSKSAAQLALGGASLVAFFALVARHLGVLARMEAARVRRDIHRRHLLRLSGGWSELPDHSKAAFPNDHAYAWDIDLCGPGSLLQRIDVTHTQQGELQIARMLGEAATDEVVRARQAAVEELAANVELRQELEAHAELAAGDATLDGRGFAQFAALPSVFEGRSWLHPLCWLLPGCTLGLYLGGTLGWWPSALWLAPTVVQVAVLGHFSKQTRAAFDLADARRGTVEAFAGMARTVERAELRSETLRAIQAALNAGNAPASSHMKTLNGWVSMAAVRQQGLLHVVLNPLTMWDLHVLRGLEAWNRRAGKHSGGWFAALGELEALACLATLRALEPESCMPELADAEQPLQAEGLAHPLLSADARVANDVTLRGPGTALMVTGSNMAGKSTLLRAVGLNVALALAGGPVCARRMCVPRVRLRAAMRAQDSLQQGASYFHAELKKLRGVVQDAEQAPPVLFLLDELLRGTNEQARHDGARAVVAHLLARRGTGLVATHDGALAAMERERPQQIANVHFTDVVSDGEMRFDYRLRPGVVRTSNALRLLAMAGIDVTENALGSTGASTPTAGPTTRSEAAPDR